MSAKTRIARALLVRDEEIPTVGYFFVFFLLVGSGMALGRGTADALFFKRYGIEYLPVMYVVLSFLLAGVSTLYAAYADRLPAERFFQILFTALLVLLGVSWSLIALTDSEAVYPAYFLIYEIASELLLIHATLYLSHNLETLQTKRLSPLILAGAQIGIVSGGVALAVLSPIIGVQNLILVWAGLLVAALIQLGWWHARCGTSPHFRAGRKGRGLAHSTRQVGQGIRLMGQSNLLRALSFAMFFMVITFFTLCYSVNRIYTETFATEAALGSFFGILTAINSSLALAAQIFITNRVIHKFGVKSVNLFFPVTSIFSYAALLVSFTLPSAILGSFNKDAVMPAFRNPVRNLFFNALPGHIQGRARATSVVVVLPLALVCTGGILWLAQRMNHPAYFVGIGLVAATAYLFFSQKMNKAYVAEIVKTLRQKLFVPEDQLEVGLRGRPGQVLDELSRGVGHPDDEIATAHARALIKAFPDRAPDIVLNRVRNASPRARDALVRLLAPLHPPELRRYLWEALEAADDHLRATILELLARLNDPDAARLVSKYLDSPNPRLQGAAILGALGIPVPELGSQALEQWQRLLASDRVEDNLAGLALVGERGDLQARTDALANAVRSAVRRLIQRAESRPTLAALRTVEAWPELFAQDLGGLLDQLAHHEDPEVRAQRTRCARFLAGPAREGLLMAALDDPHPNVRTAAAQELSADAQATHSDYVQWFDEAQGHPPRAEDALLRTVRETLAAEDLERIATAKARQARHLQHALRIVRTAPTSGDAGLQLLGHTLEERLQQVIDLALVATESIEDPEEIAVARAGIQSRDRRHLANACEILRHLDHRALSDLLSDTIEHLPYTSSANNPADLPFRDLSSVIEWCRNRRDPWLRECAQYVFDKQFSKISSHVRSV